MRHLFLVPSVVLKVWSGRLLAAIISFLFFSSRVGFFSWNTTLAQWRGGCSHSCGIVLTPSLLCFTMFCHRFYLDFMPRLYQEDLLLHHRGETGSGLSNIVEVKVMSKTLAFHTVASSVFLIVKLWHVGSRKKWLMTLTCWVSSAIYFLCKIECESPYNDSLCLIKQDVGWDAVIIHGADLNFRLRLLALSVNPPGCEIVLTANWINTSCQKKVIQPFEAKENNNLLTLARKSPFLSEHCSEYI